jgi:hypothetical protein
MPGQVPGLVSEGADSKSEVDGYEHRNDLSEDAPEPGYSREDAPEGATTAPEGESQIPAEQGSDKADVEIPEPQEGTPASSPLTYRGKQFASFDEATAHFDEVLSSREGHVRKEQERAVLLERRVNEYWDYIQKLEGTAAPEAGQPAVEPTKPKEPKDIIDMDKVQRVMKLAEKQGWDPAATGLRMVAEQLTEHFNKTLEERLKAELAPVREQTDAMNRYSEEVLQQQQLFSWAQGLADEATGDAVYPDLARDENGLVDEGRTKYVYAAWRELANIDPQFAYSAMGFDYAYRMGQDLIAEAAEWNTAHGNPPATTPTNGAVTRDERTGRFVSTNLGDVRASSSLTGTSQSPAGTPRQRMSEEEAMINRIGSLKTVKGKTGMDLGFFE